MSSNIKIIRQNLNNSNLCTDELEIGEHVKKKLRIIYIKDLTDEEHNKNT